MKNIPVRPKLPLLSLCSYGKLNHELAEHQPWVSPPDTREENQQCGQKEENWQKSVIPIFKQIPSVCIRSFLSALLLYNIQNELVSSVMSSHGMHRNTGLMGPKAGS